MYASLLGILWVFGLGMFYLVAAIPTGVAFHLHIATAAVIAWAGYVTIAIVMLLAGEPVRNWVTKKFNITATPDPAKLFWRVWMRFGMIGLGFLAPVTCGPFIGALIAVSLGEKRGRVIFWIAAGVVPWCLAFAIMTATGAKALGH